MTATPMGAGWRVVRASVTGTSHDATGTPCQDATDVARLDTPDGTVLALVCADGAGSARLAHEGATLACTTVLGAVRDWVAHAPLGTATRDTVVDWIDALRRALVAHAATRDATARDLACTLLLAVIGADGAVFAQIGDGAIVVDAPEPVGYVPVFWPQAGAYANTTFFATDDDAVTRLLVTVVHGCTILDVALFSDGLQALALRFEDRSVHAPFFRPMFAQLRDQPAGDAPALQAGLRTFLDSPRINARTDDDKTLVLATRGAASDGAPRSGSVSAAAGPPG